MCSGATTWENGAFPTERPSPLSAQAPGSYRDKEGGLLLLLFYPIILLVLDGWGPVHLSF